MERYNLDILGMIPTIGDAYSEGRKLDANGNTQVSKNDSRNLEAWMVILTHSRINNNLNFYKKFEEINDSKNFFIIDYLFYDNKRIQSNKKISNSFLSIFSDPSLISTAIASSM